VGRRAVVQRVAAERLVPVEVHSAVRGNQRVRAVLLVVGGAFLAWSLDPAETRVALGADADPVSDLDPSFGLAPHPDGGADDFVADAARVIRRALVR
jgi:hypothetical protein